MLMDPRDGVPREPAPVQRVAASSVQARSRLAARILREIWTSSAVCDVGIWGESLARVEAARRLGRQAGDGATPADSSPAA